MIIRNDCLKNENYSEGGHSLCDIFSSKMNKKNSVALDQIVSVSSWLDCERWGPYTDIHFDLG